MDTTTIFLFFVFACLGAAIGALLQRAQDKRGAAPPPPASPSPNKLAKEGDIQVFSAWRTSNDKVWLEMDGQRLENKDALQADQRQRLIGAILDLRPWLEGARSSSPAVPAPVAVSQKPQPSPVAPAGKPKGKAGEAAKPVPALKSIVEQIDEVLQTKILASPYRDREISLIEGPGGTVIVKDGSTRYEGINTVPDPGIKALIREAVTEWEKTAK